MSNDPRVAAAVPSALARDVNTPRFGYVPLTSKRWKNWNVLRIDQLNVGVRASSHVAALSTGTMGSNRRDAEVTVLRLLVPTLA